MKFINSVLKNVKKSKKSTSVKKGLSYHEVEQLQAGNSSSVGMIVFYR